MAVLEYVMLVDRPKAKSKVRKHFGFPADNIGTILNKKKIICFSGGMKGEKYILL